MGLRAHGKPLVTHTMCPDRMVRAGVALGAGRAPTHTSRPTMVLAGRLVCTCWGAGYFLPWFATAWIASAAASGSRYSPGLTGL